MLMMVDPEVHYHVIPRYSKHTMFNKIKFVDHHEAHIASSLLFSKFSECVNLSIDGFGDFASSAYGIYKNNKLEIDNKVSFPHSMGIFYQALRTHLDGSGCSECSQSLGARRVSHWLTEHEIYYELEAPIPAGKKGLPLRADFFLPEHNMYIEYDGEQHFKPIAFFGMDEKTSISVFNEQKERDLAKENWILGKGFELLRIRFDQNVEHQLEKYFQV